MGSASSRASSGSSAEKTKAAQWSVQNNGYLVLSLWDRSLCLGGWDGPVSEALREAAASISPSAVVVTTSPDGELSAALSVSPEELLLLLCRLFSGLRSLGWRFSVALRLVAVRGYSGSALLRRSEAPGPRRPVFSAQLRDFGAALLLHDAPTSFLEELERRLKAEGAAVSTTHPAPFIHALHIISPASVGLRLLILLWAALEAAGATLIGKILNSGAQICFFEYEEVESSAFQSAAKLSALGLCGDRVVFGDVDSEVVSELVVELGRDWTGGFTITPDGSVQLASFALADHALRSESTPQLDRILRFLATQGLHLAHTLTQRDGKELVLLLREAGRQAQEEQASSCVLSLSEKGRLTLSRAPPDICGVVGAILRHTWAGKILDDGTSGSGTRRGWVLRGGDAGSLGFLLSTLLRKLGARGWGLSADLGPAIRLGLHATGLSHPIPVHPFAAT